MLFPLLSLAMISSADLKICPLLITGALPQDEEQNTLMITTLKHNDIYLEQNVMEKDT